MDVVLKKFHLFKHLRSVAKDILSSTPDPEEHVKVSVLYLAVLVGNSEGKAKICDTVIQVIFPGKGGEVFICMYGLHHQILCIPLPSNHTVHHHFERASEKTLSS